MRRLPIVTNCAETNFNPRTHVGCDVCQITHHFGVVISIHAPTWGATSVRGAMCSLPTNFNPRTHVGCDARTVVRTWNNAISIHAPTWGATLSPLEATATERFQSTHPRGVRPTWSRKVCGIWRFQSTHPRGVRPQPCDYVEKLPVISIHAPTWGATFLSFILLAAIYISIHAPTWGATHQESCYHSTCGFQSTHPRGVRLDRLVANTLQERFQSTHPRGVRQQFDIRNGCKSRFQSTHPRGVRLSWWSRRESAHGFQSTHPRGVRLCVTILLPSQSVFQSTHPRGVRRAI